MIFTVIPLNFLRNKAVIFVALFSLTISCRDTPISQTTKNKKIESLVIGSADTLELKKGDILVRPNLNILPGTSFIDGGKNYGHAALVVKGYRHWNTDSLLAGTIIIESIAKDVPAEFQIREINALVSDKFESFDNHNFDSRYKGNRYRLRLSLTEKETDSIIAFARSQKGKLSSWNASKYFPDNKTNNTITGGLNQNQTWYCSLLVWQSIYNITGIDLDQNGGYMVYPNDLINSGYFNELPNGEGRIRF
jgi:hypothetical protein